LVLGAGESGVGAAILAKDKGYAVFVSDGSSIKGKYKNILETERISYEENKHSYELFSEINEVIKSPGIPENTPIVKFFTDKKIPVISEIEFACRYTTAKIVGITGTNGKTTTTSLIYHILKKANYNVGLGGNIGKSFALQVAREKFDYYVLELSSFQLDGMYNSKIDVAILCNITPDHLNRYEYKLENYANSKFRILQNQDSNCHFIFCADDPLTQTFLPKKINAQIHEVSLKKEVSNGAFLQNDEIIFNTFQDTFKMNIYNLALNGKHNAYNSMVAGIAARALEVRKQIISESLQDFENIEHRLEFVAKVNGIEFINDSKATNINSTWYALESMNNPTVWIVGGEDKGNDYDEIMEVVMSKVKAIVCLGLDNSKIIKAFEGKIEIITETNSAEMAVKQAYRLASKGDTVLLSPACASFDLFENFEDRGRKFKQAVRSL
jgi:UDP-N-acetylmuramoylalanine--D-glutamate ligase